MQLPSPLTQNQLKSLCNQHENLIYLDSSLKQVDAKYNYEPDSDIYEPD